MPADGAPRARARAGKARVAVPPDAHERLFGRFLDALARDDEAAVVRLLAEEATFTSDGGGKVPAARNVLAGPGRITRLVLGVHRKWASRLGLEYRLVRVNGEPTLLTFAAGRLLGTTSIATDGERIHAVYHVLNPDKLRRLAAELGVGVFEAADVAAVRGRS